MLTACTFFSRPQNEFFNRIGREQYFGRVEQATKVKHASASVPPQVLEPIRPDLCVADSMLNILVPEVVLQCAAIVPVVWNLITAACEDGEGRGVWPLLPFGSQRSLQVHTDHLTTCAYVS